MNSEKPSADSADSLPLQPVSQTKKRPGMFPNLNREPTVAPDSFQKVAAWNQYNSTNTPPTVLPPDGFLSVQHNPTGVPMQFGMPSPFAPSYPGFMPHNGFPGFINPEERKTSSRGSISTPATAPNLQIPNYMMVHSFHGHTKSISVVRFSPCGNYLGTGGADKIIKVWRVLDWHLERTLTSHHLGVNDFSWSSNSNFIASACDDKLVRIFDVAAGKCIRKMAGHTSYVFCCAFNPQSTLIVSGAFDDSIIIWDFKTGKIHKKMPAHTDPVTSVCFNNDGSLIATSSYDGYIRIWDATSGTCQKTLTDTDHAPVSCVVFAPNGKFLLSAHLDSSLRVWDHAKGQQVKQYEGHLNEKWCIFASFAVIGGKNVMCGSEDGKIFVWDIQTKTLLQSFKSHATAVLATDAHPTQMMIVSGGIEPDNIIKIFRSM